MDKNAIKKFAVWARKELIARVSLKGVEYGITEGNIEDANVDSVGGKVLTADEKKQRQALIAEINDKGYKQVMEEVAYTWFNRFSALRFMEVNGYIPSHVRVFTDEENNFKPQIITEAIHLDLDGLDMEKVYELKDAEKTEELYKYLLIVQCNALNKILPGMFQKIADYTELLLPDTNGMELCQRLRSWHHCPIIFTSCLDDTDTVVRALELGGDDFLTKPYNHKVLLARIMANIRRVQMDAAEPSVSGYHCAAFTLDSNSHCVEKDGRSIHLADMEYRILTLFIRHPNTFFTANELYRKIWGKESLGDVRTVQVHIHNLRSKIEPDPAKPIYLKNVWGKGYIFRPEGETEA